MTAFLIFQIVPEFADFGKESAGFGGVFAAFILGKFLIELLEDVLLLFREIDGGFDENIDIEVTARIRTQHGHAFALKAELLTGLRSCGHFDLGGAAFDGGHFDITAERRARDRDRYAAMQVCAIALEELMGLTASRT